MKRSNLGKASAMNGAIFRREIYNFRISRRSSCPPSKRAFELSPTLGGIEPHFAGFVFVRSWLKSSGAIFHWPANTSENVNTSIIWPTKTAQRVRIRVEKRDEVETGRIRLRRGYESLNPLLDKATIFDGKRSKQQGYPSR